MRRALLAAIVTAAALPALATADSPPLATISAGPPDPSSSATASFMFSANENERSSPARSIRNRFAAASRR